jgi:hypothetical protein
LPPVLGLEGLVKDGVLGRLEVEGGMRLEDIEGVIWSHW